MSWTREEWEKIDAAITRCAVGRERPGSWHELLAHQKAINDAHDKVVELMPDEYSKDGKS